MKPILFWDFNGTILDDVHLTWQIETKMLQERHMRTYTLEEYKDMFCFPVINYGSISKTVDMTPCGTEI